MKPKYSPSILLTLLIILSASCTRSVTPAALPSPTLTPHPTYTPILPTLTPTLTATPTQTPFMPFAANAMVDNLMFRANPGYLFPAMKMLREGTEFLVLGQSPGGDWLQIQLSEDERGWVFTELVVFDRDLATIPIVQPEDAQVVTGKVLDQDGIPVGGMHFTIIQGSGANAPRNDALTDADGIFYLFMPMEASGNWTLVYTAVSCKSNKMDSQCNWLNGIAGQPYPEQVTLTLPQAEPLEFTWK